ncbi:MAG: mechanosensitive ion channel family protein [Acidobacteriota bacterium]
MIHRFIRPLPAALALALLLLQAPTARGQGEEAAATGTLRAEVETTDDETLARGLEQRFDQIDDLAGVEASAEAGVVTLAGKVLSEADRLEAEELARQIEGVAGVSNRIEVELDPRLRLAPALDEATDRLRTLISYLPLFLIALVIVVLFYLLARWVGRWDGLYARIAHNRFAQDILRQAVRTGILVVGILVALELLDATALVGAVLGAAGVLGLALGFAFRDLVENYLASVLMSLRQPFAPNDHVRIDDLEGKVVRLTSRATILMTLDGNHLRIPNSQVFKGVILNYSRNPNRRFDFGVGVGVGEDLVEAQRLGVDALVTMESVLEDPGPRALITELGDSSVTLRFWGWVDQREADFGKVKGEAIRRVKKVLEGAGMDLPEPIYRIHMVRGGAPEPATPPAAPPNRDHVADLTPDDDVERQIAEDRATDEGGTDLLSESGPTE